MTFSDDSDTEGLKSVLSPIAGKAPIAGCKTPKSVCCSKRALLPRSLEMGGSQLSSSSVGRGCRSSTRPRRGRTAGGTEKKERAARRAPSWKGDEERELLCAIEEKEKVEEQVNVSLELLQASEDEAQGELGKGNGIAGSFRLTPSCTFPLLAPARGPSVLFYSTGGIQRRLEGADMELEGLRQEVGGEVLARQRLGSTEPLCLSALHNVLPAVDGEQTRGCGVSFWEQGAEGEL